MSNDSTDETTAAKQEAADQVVERVSSWDEGSQPDVARGDLKEGFEEAGVSVDDTEVERLADDIHDGDEPDVDGDAVS